MVRPKMSRVCVMLAVLGATLGLQANVVRAAPPPDASLRRSSDDEGYRGDRYDYRSADDGSRYEQYGPGAARRGSYRDGYDRLAARRAHNRQAEEIQRPSSYSYDGPPEGPDAYRDGGPTSEGSYEGRYETGRYGDPRYMDGPYDDGPSSGFYDGDGYDDCCDDCDDYSWCSSGPIYVRGEYLLWWIKGDSLPPLVTTSPQGTPRAQAGVLGQPDTSVLFGGTRVNGGGRSGGRFVLGWWADACNRVEAEWFGLAQSSANYSQSSTGDPILARPFFNLGTGAQDSNVLAFPGQLSGNVQIAETSNFVGAAIRAATNVICSNNCSYNHSVDFVYGYRYLRLRENLSIDSSLEVTDPQSPLLGTTFASNDSFTATNNFNGAMIGVMATNCGTCWSLVTSGRLGIGGTWERVVIDGQSTATQNDQSTTSPGGLLAMPTNIGNYKRTAFSVVPEVELKVGYNWTPRLKFTIGYDLIYWSRVARPGSQIDTFVNTSQASGQPLVGTPGPLFPFRETDLWVQGLSIGGEWCW